MAQFFGSFCGRGRGDSACFADGGSTGTLFHMGFSTLNFPCIQEIRTLFLTIDLPSMISCRFFSHTRCMLFGPDCFCSFPILLLLVFFFPLVVVYLHVYVCIYGGYPSEKKEWIHQIMESCCYHGILCLDFIVNMFPFMAYNIQYGGLTVFKVSVLVGLV